MIKEYGFIEPVIKEDHWVLGGLGSIPKVKQKPEAGWPSLKILKERQNLRFETWNCTGFDTLQCIERLEFAITKKEVNYSDRWLGIVAGTKRPGNDPHKVAEAIRKHGLIPEEMLPWSEDLNNVDEYYSFKGADEDKCRAEGKKWLETHKFLHEWVFKGEHSLEERAKRMIEALDYSPLGISVTAWFKHGNVYVDNGARNTHWTSEIDYVTDVSWEADDSYLEEDSSTKHIAWEHNIRFCKRYYLEIIPKGHSIGQEGYWPYWIKDLWGNSIDFIKDIINKIFKGHD